MNTGKPSRLWTGTSSIHSFAASVTNSADLTQIKIEDLKEGLLFVPHYDDRLAAEVTWYASVLDRLFPQSGPRLTSGMVCRAICETLMSVGLAVCDQDGEWAMLKLSADYRRSASILVLLFAVLEVVSDGIKEGCSDDECLNRASEFEDWRPIEPIPPEIRPLVRKAQRAFPVSLVRKMLPDLFWFVSMPRLLEEGLIEFVPAQFSLH
jgi:hypothetical protein